MKDLIGVIGILIIAGLLVYMFVTFIRVSKEAEGKKSL
ncbi:hypothetical protein HG1285_14754 [Hydrogenivirga sp. 128-5-R1-1]|nr:hypothetical protein HG1285_14754 [Hydrogenivirga sp. 128-5-R1-1]